LINYVYFDVLDHKNIDLPVVLKLVNLISVDDITTSTNIYVLLNTICLLSGCATLA